MAHGDETAAAKGGELEVTASLMDGVWTYDDTSDVLESIFGQSAEMHNTFRPVSREVHILLAHDADSDPPVHELGSVAEIVIPVGSKMCRYADKYGNGCLASLRGIALPSGIAAHLIVLPEKRLRISIDPW